MEALRITGGTPLRGTVAVAGAKNAALPILAATLLATSPVRLLGVPHLLDVATLGLLLRRLGVSVARCPDDSLVVETIDDRPRRADDRLVRRMRASFCVLGPLLARRGKADVPLPGGCQLGPRPVDLHLRGLAALGAEICIEHGYVKARVKRLRGADIDLMGPHGPTVTGTANVLSAAVLAAGTTTLHGAAVEPEIVDLGRFLRAIGADIQGLGTPELVIRGVTELRGATHRIIPDRIEAATLLAAGIITGGQVTVTGVEPAQMGASLGCFAAMGVPLAIGADRVTVRPAVTGLLPVDAMALPYPGLPTDVQPQVAALCCLAGGVSRLRDRVFPQRQTHVPELIRLGAQIQVTADEAIVRGVPRLLAADVVAPDLRAAAALLLAGLAADGRTTLRGVQHLDRGYDRLDAKLRQLGAVIERVKIQRSRAPWEATSQR